MGPQRSSRPEEPSLNAYASPEAAAALHAGCPPATDKPKAEADEGLSVFWRVFGAAIFSMVCLVLINVYQSLSGAIQEVRRDVVRLSESRSEMIDKAEHAAVRQQLWTRIQEVQTLANTAIALKDRLMLLEAERKEFQALATAVTTLQERSLARDAEWKLLNEDFKRGDQNLQVALTAVKDRLTTIDQQLKAVDGLGKQLEQSAKDLQTVQTSLSGVREKCLGRDAMCKQLQDDAKEMAKDVHALRERLAKFEGVVEAKTNPDKPPKAQPASRSQPKPEVEPSPEE